MDHETEWRTFSLQAPYALYPLITCCHDSPLNTNYSGVVLQIPIATLYSLIQAMGRSEAEDSTGFNSETFQLSGNETLQAK